MIICSFCKKETEDNIRCPAIQTQPLHKRPITVKNYQTCQIRAKLAKPVDILILCDKIKMSLEA